MTYCIKCGKPTNNGIMCEDCIISDSPWLLAMKRKEDDLVEQIEQFKSENTALRKRLENAVEFPRLEVSPYDNNDTLLYYLENGHIQQECFNNKHSEQLQKRLAELKGDKSDW